MLKIRNLSKIFNNKAVLNNISLDIKNGEIALLLGQSGVGKSTLLRILNNLEDYNSGEITLNIDSREINLKNIKLSEEKNLVGMIFQQFNLFEHMSVERNISFVLEKSTKKSKQEIQTITHDLLLKYGLSDKAKLSVNDLSGGQKQRLAIARTLALNPAIICFDEPTSALDPKLTNFIAKNIEELKEQNYIILVATHDVGLIERLDCTIYLMHDGKIIEQAKSIEYLAHKDQYPLIENFVSGKLD